MSKMFLCTLLIFGFINTSFGQFNLKSERVMVIKYDDKGHSEKIQLKDKEALSFDFPTYIKENDNLERLVIRGTFVDALKTTIVTFDSNNQENVEADHICKEVKSKLTPFLGVWGTGIRDFSGVDIKEIVPTTAAAIAGITEDENIIAFNGTPITKFSELKKSVLSSQIGDKVELTLLNENDREYSKYAIIGSRGVETVTYNYCLEENANNIVKNNLDASLQEVTLTSFPNPTTDLIHVNFKPLSNEDVTFSVMDITGKIIHKQLYTNFDGPLAIDYNLNKETAGTYIIAIQQGKEVYNTKVQLIKE